MISFLPEWVLDGEGEADGEDRVGAAGLAVHVGGGDGAALVPLHDQIVYLLGSKSTYTNVVGVILWFIKYIEKYLRHPSPPFNKNKAIIYSIMEYFATKNCNIIYLITGR